MTAWQVVKKKGKRRTRPPFPLLSKSFTELHLYFILYQQNLCFLVMQAGHTFFNNKGKSVLANARLTVWCSSCWRALPFSAALPPAWSQGFTDTSGSLPGMSESNSSIPLPRSGSFVLPQPWGLQQALPHTVPALGQVLWQCSCPWELPACMAGGAGRRCTAVLCSFTWLQTCTFHCFPESTFLLWKCDTPD